MASRLNDIRKRAKEKHRRKKEEERRQQQEEQKRALAAARPPVMAATVDNGSEGDGYDYTRVRGEYGWEWKKVNNHGNNETAGLNKFDTTRATMRNLRNDDVEDDKDNGSVRPTVRRSLDFDVPRVTSKTINSKDGWLTTNKTTATAAPATRMTASAPSASGPLSFVSKTVAASPLSDVTCSQSPSSSKRSKVSFAMATATKTESEATVDENDPLLVMERLAAQKKTKAAAVATKGSSLPPNPAFANNGRSQGVDPMDVSRRLSVGKSNDPMEVMARMKELEDKRKMEQDVVASNQDSDDDSSDNDEQEVRSSTREARNPIALERNSAGTLGRRSFSPQASRHDDGDLCPVNNDGRRHAASLWDDSEDEEGAIKPTAARKKKGGNKEQKPSKKKGNRKAASRPLDYDEDDDVDSDGEREETLIPSFSDPKMGPPSVLEPLPLPRGANQKIPHEIPPAINRYLKAYQQQGVVFLHSCIMRGTGAILGDDMGMGKTVQIISLLASLFRKTGTGKDATDLHRRRRLIAQKMREFAAARDEALLYDGVALPTADTIEVEGLFKSGWDPVLVIVPPSVIDNWKNEFKTWGHFSVGTYQGNGRSQALDKVKDGTNEVLVCGKTLAMNDYNAISQVKWKLIVVDEVHNYKNKHSKAYEKLTELRNSSQCPMIGMTGTIMPNRHEELWNLIDLVAPDHLGDWGTFEQLYSGPIKYARVKAATADTIQQSISCSSELDAKLKLVYIRRSKEVELADELPEKDELVLFCEPTRIQKALYQFILGLPDYELIRYANAPCDCGVNRAIFMGYKKLRTAKERIAFQRMHRSDIVRRKKCCYQTPWNPNRDFEGEPWIHPDAVLWKSQHEEDKECDGCPFCVSFPAMKKLERLSSHAALLLAEQDASSLPQGSTAWKEATKQVAFAKVAIPPDLLSELPGRDHNPYVRHDGVMNDHAKLSGKMEKLDRLLREFDRGQNRVLVFSHYTKTLDLIQQFVQSRGYTFVRLDGSTSTPDRQKLVDKFQNDPAIFLFLMSTKAGGLGLNLTAANKVIEFDLDFNPSHDEQAQDRAYRIGQKSDVKVFRLISKGTIEEQKYIRQVYKVHLKNDTIRDPKEAEHQARIFRGVEGDKNRKGEVFGMENLLKFKDGSFMGDLWKSSDRPPPNGEQAISVEDVKNSLTEFSSEEVLEIGGNTFDEDFDHAAGADKSEGGQDGIAAVLAGQYAINHQDLFRADGGEAAEGASDDELLGGCSQNYLDVLDGAADGEDDGSPSVPSGGAAARQSTAAVAPAVAVAVPAAPTEDAPRPRKRRAASAFATSLETVTESPSQLQFADAMHDFPGEQECIEASGRAAKRSKKKDPPIKKAPPPAKATEEAKTRFSSQDLFVPQYKKKKKKKTKK